MLVQLTGLLNHRPQNPNWVSGQVGYRDMAFFKIDLIIFTKIQTEFFEVFTFPVEFGDSQTPLKDLSSVVISKSISKKYFGEENPIDSTLTIFREEKNYDFIVTAVISDAPPNSSFKPDIASQGIGDIVSLIV